MEIRNIQLELLKEFQYICNQLDIDYYAIYGTLLGAIRHNGYIPWDDDIDIAIWRRDVEKIKHFSGSYKKKYRFVFDDNENCNCGVIKFIDTETTCLDIGAFSDNYFGGIWIDIEIIDYTYTNEIKRKDKDKRLQNVYEAMFYKRYVSYSHVYVKMDEERKNEIDKLIQKYSYDELAKISVEVSVENDEEDVCSIYTLHQNHMFMSKWFCSAVNKTFENIDISIPKEYEKVLEASYGNDYMILPSEKERYAKHTRNMIIDLQKSYSAYTNKVKEFYKIPPDSVFVIWGAGMMAKYFLEKFGQICKPDYIIDSNSELWGNMVDGIEIVGPDVLDQLNLKKLHLVICNNYYMEIAKKHLKPRGYEPYYFPESYVKKNEKYYIEECSKWAKMN